MAVREEPVKSFQGYSIVRITETDTVGRTVMETFALTHAAGGVIAEYALMQDAVRELNRMLFPLPGLEVAGGCEAL